MSLIKDIDDKLFLSDEYPSTLVPKGKITAMTSEWVDIKFFTFDKEQRQNDATEVWPFANIYGSLRDAYPTRGHIEYYYVEVTCNEGYVIYKVKTYKRAVKLVKNMRKRYMAAIRKLGLIEQ